MPRSRKAASKNSQMQNPVAQFSRWFHEEVAAGTELPEAVALATASREAIPCVRFVLLKQADEQGFCFYTDIRSPKGRQLIENPHAAMVFCSIARDAESASMGRSTLTTPREADDYWATRPLASRLSGSISQQSHPIGSREELVTRVAELSTASRMVPDNFL